MPRKFPLPKYANLSFTLTWWMQGQVNEVSTIAISGALNRLGILLPAVTPLVT